MTYPDRLEKMMNQVLLTMTPILNEKQCRLLVASMAKGYGHGGIKLVSEKSGMDVRTIRSGINEIDGDIDPKILSKVTLHKKI